MTNSVSPMLRIFALPRRRGGGPPFSVAGSIR
jgi:hypothetical protein